MADDIDENDETGPETEVELAPIDSRNPDMIGTARRRYGGAGAALAAGMLGLDILLGNKKKPDSVQVQEAPTEPVDVDTDGIQVTIDDALSVNAPALERVPPIAFGKRKSRRG